MVPRSRSFEERARSLFALRMPFLLGAGTALASPGCSGALGLTSPTLAWSWLASLAAAAGLAATLSRLPPLWQRRMTLAGLWVDAATLSLWILGTGGLRSPLLPAQLLLTGVMGLLFPRPAAALPGVGSLALVAWLGARRQEGPLHDLAVLLVLGSLHLALAYLLSYLHRRERALRQERDRIWGELGAAQERARLAREIHDGVGGSVAALVMQAQLLDAPGPLLETAREALDELRRSLQLMRDDFDLLEAVRAHCQVVAERTGLEVDVRLEGGPPPLGAEGRLSLFRVVQEGLTNASRHARASRVSVVLRCAQDATRLEIRDDGIGIPTGTQGGYGLRGLRERAQLLGGSVSVEGSPGCGTVIDLVVPHEKEGAWKGIAT